MVYITSPNIYITNITLCRSIRPEPTRLRQSLHAGTGDLSIQQPPCMFQSAPPGALQCHACTVDPSPSKPPATLLLNVGANGGGIGRERWLTMENPLPSEVRR
ncbi:hypothetical protein V6N13_013450 [Hibiscus sabdariffa]